MIGHGTKLEPDITVWLVEIPLFKFLYYHLTLNLKHFGVKGKTQHPVAFKPESGFKICGWNSQIIIGDVITCEGIILATRFLQRGIIIRNVG